MRYDYSFLKSEYEHEHIQYQRMMEELRAQFQTQVTEVLALSNGKKLNTLP